MPNSITTMALIAALLTSFAQAQWVDFANETSVRMPVGPGLNDPLISTSDPDEKDYAWGDLDQDGDIDLVCARTLGWETIVPRRNVLFMNEGMKEGHAIDGVLVDRTDLYAVESDVAGDLGFLTPTNDRDVKLADVNGDGWLDVITAVTHSSGQPKHISHPRVYINKGADARGQWMGLRYEDARIPQLGGYDQNGIPHAPAFNNVAVGDVTGDGLPDLYFTDSDFLQATYDFNHRLLANQGGFFVDVTTSTCRLHQPPQERESPVKSRT